MVGRDERPHANVRGKRRQRLHLEAPNVCDVGTHICIWVPRSVSLCFPSASACACCSGVRTHVYPWRDEWPWILFCVCVWDGAGGVGRISERQYGGSTFQGVIRLLFPSGNSAECSMFSFSYVHLSPVYVLF